MIEVISPYRTESILDYDASSIGWDAEEIIIHSSPYRTESIMQTVNLFL